MKSNVDPTRKDLDMRSVKKAAWTIALVLGLVLAPAVTASEQGTDDRSILEWVLEKIDDIFADDEPDGTGSSAGPAPDPVG